MPLTGLFVQLGSLAADRNGLAAMALIGIHEPDAAVAVLVVVPVHECTGPGAGFFHAVEWPPGVVRPVFHGAEQRLRVGVVIADTRPGERPQNAQLLQPGFQGGRSHGIAVVGMEDQRLAAPSTDPLPQAGPADEISGDLCVLAIGDIPGHHFAAPDVDHQIEVEPDTTHAGGQVGDVPAPP